MESISEPPALADVAASVYVLFEVREGSIDHALHFSNDFTITLGFTAQAAVVGMPRDAIRACAPQIDLFHLGETSKDLLRGLLRQRLDLIHVVIVRRTNARVILDLWNNTDCRLTSKPERRKNLVRHRIRVILRVVCAITNVVAAWIGMPLGR